MFGRAPRPEEADPDGYVRSFYDQLQPEPEWLDKAGRLRGFLQGAQASAVFRRHGFGVPARSS